MKGTAKSFPELREYCETIPLVDCHDHTSECGPKHEDAIQMIAQGYFNSDLTSASSDDEVNFMHDKKKSLEERWPVLERAWKRTCHTGYGRLTRLMLKKFYDEDQLTLEALKRIQGKLLDFTDEKRFDEILQEANIAVRLQDIWPDVKKVVDGSLKLSPRSRIVISTPRYHRITSYQAVKDNAAPVMNNVTSLDEYLDACRKIFEAYKRFGAVAFKDQSAYGRPIDYGNPTRAAAEEVFNWFMEDPRRSASYPDGVRPLDDFLFHSFMRMARDLELPVQIHTGHMAGIRNDIAKTNAVGLTKLMELHREVQFDIFHANWPYSGELLYLCKNFPNVAIDFCWANIIDPLYCIDMFKQALSSVPHGKIHGYGTDYGGQPEKAWAHARIARDNVATALSDMVEMEYLDVDEAREVAYAWLFGNANAFFKLGL